MKCQNLFSGKNKKHISKCPLLKFLRSMQETICIKCQSLLSGRYKKNITSLSSAELAQKMVKVNSILNVRYGHLYKSLLFLCKLDYTAVICYCF